MFRLPIILLASFVTAQTVHVGSGNINGVKCPSTNVNSFLGIPYAAPPVNDLRFAPTQAYNATYPSGTLDATAQPNICIQFVQALSAPGGTSEDCLYLNVYAPAAATTNSKLPVKFWIHGGAFAAGGITDPVYDGCNIATDSIVVLAAYRLGPLGFLYEPTIGIQGNMAVQDLLTALQWVQSNIASFGGDPKKVVVFGQSAGASSAWLLSTLPSAPSLMNAVIGESGAGIPFASTSAAGNFSNLFASNLGCSDITCFRNASTQNMITASPPLQAIEVAAAGKRFGPLIDGKIVPSDPNTVGSKVPLIAGTTTMEGTLFTLLQNLNFTTWTAQNYSDILTTFLGSYASTVNNTFPISLFQNTPIPGFYATANLVTKLTFFCPNMEALTSTIAAGQPVWTYLWDHSPSCGWESFLAGSFGPQLLQLLGPTHTSEIPFVFNKTTNLPPPNGTCNFNTAEDSIANFMVDAWTSMAENQNPGGNWPQWNTNTSMGLQVVNSTAFGLVNYTGCSILNEILAAVNNGTATAGQNSTSTGGATSTSSGATATSSVKSAAIRLTSGNILLLMVAMVLLL